MALTMSQLADLAETEVEVDLSGPARFRIRRVTGEETLRGGGDLEIPSGALEGATPVVTKVSNRDLRTMARQVDAYICAGVIAYEDPDEGWQSCRFVLEDQHANLEAGRLSVRVLPLPTRRELYAAIKEHTEGSGLDAALAQFPGERVAAANAG